MRLEENPRVGFEEREKLEDIFRDLINDSEGRLRWRKRSKHFNQLED